MKKSILLLLIFMVVATGAFAQANITGKVDVDVDIANAFNDDTVEFTTEQDNTEVDISAAVDEFSSITIQFRGEGDAIQAGDIFLESDIVGAFGMTGEATSNLVLKLKGGLFTPEPSEVGEVKEYSNLSDVIGVDDVAGGGAALLTVGYTDWVSLSGGARFDLDGSDDFGWVANIIGSGAIGPGTLKYSAYITNENTPLDRNDGQIDPTEIGVGVQYSGLQGGSVATAGGTLAEPGSVPIIDFGIGAQFWIQPFVAGGGDLTDGLEDQGNIWQYGVNVAFTFLSFIDLVLDIQGQDGAALNAIGAGIGVSNPGENVGRIFGLDLIFRAEELGDEAAYSIEPRIRLKLGNTGAQFRFGVPIDIDDPEDSAINLDVALSF